MHQNNEKGHSYKTFGLMLATSFIIMYAVMFLNIFQPDHIYLSLTRIYMTLLMVTPMAVSMLLFMRKMYMDRNLNYVIIGGAVALFIFSLYGLRSQAMVGDIQWMKAMIPHHSSALLTSSNANLRDPEVKKLAEDIIRSQEREIQEMKAMIERLEK